jgi:hypothetical protein
MSADDRLEDLYGRYIQFTSEMVELYDPMEVAAIMMTQALSIYRTGLDELDYNRMVDSISSNRGNIKKFTPNILQ